LGKAVPVGWLYSVSPHFGDRFWTLYNLTYVPTHVTDGIDVIVGGSYAVYLNAFNKRENVSSPLTLAFVSKSATSSQAHVKVKVKLEEAVSSGKKVFVVMWEDHARGGSYTWRYTERDMASHDLTVTSKGQEQVFENTFPVTGYNLANLGVSVFVQDVSGTKEILNGNAATFAGAAVEPDSLGRVKAIFK
jgi:hypothetical protein